MIFSKGAILDLLLNPTLSGTLPCPWPLVLEADLGVSFASASGVNSSSLEGEVLLMS